MAGEGGDAALISGRVHVLVQLVQDADWRRTRRFPGVGQARHCHRRQAVTVGLSLGLQLESRALRSIGDSKEKIINVAGCFYLICKCRGDNTG